MNRRAVLRAYLKQEQADWEHVDDTEYISIVNPERVLELLDLIEELEAALEFYADPLTYTAIMLVSDPPCGEFIDDRSEVTREIDGRTVVVPGAKAREAVELTKP